METFATSPSDGGASPVHLHVYRDRGGQACAYLTVRGHAPEAAMSGVGAFGAELSETRRIAAEIARTMGAATVVVFDPLGLVARGRPDEGLHPEDLNAANDG